MRICTLLSLFVVGLAVPALAQKPAPPDLSGTWVFNPAKSTLPKGATPNPETLVITCAEERIEIAASAAGKQILTTWTTNGKEYTRNPGGNIEIYASARWKKGVLFTESGVRAVIGGGMDRPDFAKDSERWSLSTDGRTLTREFEGAKQTFVYDKQ
jgi:hypothetical protein